MCEHEWITTRAVYRESVVDGYKNHEINRRVCIICLKTKDEIDLEQQLTAANTRIAELEKSNKKWSIVVDDLKQLSETDKQRAEQAEAQCAAMQTAINRYVFGNIELLDALKAALEEKP